MNIHKGIHIDVLDEALASIGAQPTDLATCGAVGLILFDSAEEMEIYEGRVLDEARGIRRKRRTPEEVETMRRANKRNAAKGGRPVDNRANRETIAAYLKEWRERAGLSKMDVASLMGSTMYYAYEKSSGGRKIQLPTRANWLKLKEILGFDDTHDSEMMAE